MRGRYQTRPAAPQHVAPVGRVVQAAPAGAVVTAGALRGRRLASLSGYQLEDLRDWTGAQLARRRGQVDAFARELEAQAAAIQDERERRWAELIT